MGLTYSDNSLIAELSVKSVTGRPGVGFYRLLFEVSISQHRISKTWSSFREIWGQVRVGSPGNAHNELGRINPEVPIAMVARKSSSEVPSSFTFSHLFYIDLNPLQIEHIEGLRNGGDIEFDIQISGITDGEHGPHTAHDWLHFPAMQGTWLKVLKEMKYREFLLFEIPIPSENTSDELKQALMHLTQAKDHLLKGHYDDVVGKCRLVLEGVTKGLKEGSDFQTAIDAYKNRKEEMKKDQRFLFLREAARHVCHLPHHVSDEPNGVSYDREEAKCVLGVTAAILARSLQ